MQQSTHLLPAIDFSFLEAIANSHIKTSSINNEEVEDPESIANELAGLSINTTNSLPTNIDLSLLISAIITKPPDIIWKIMGSLKENPEGKYTCPKCKQNCTVHPEYIKAGIDPCLGVKCKNDVESIAKQMCLIRGFIFKFMSEATKKIESNRGNSVVNFICGVHGHTSSLVFGMLRKGAGCKGCHGLIRTRTDNNEELMDRPICTCKGTRNRTPTFCAHYNHFTHGNGSADEWDLFLNNGLTPYQIAPTSHEPRWFRCKNDHCRMPYFQSPKKRILQGRRCPYCVGQKACYWNCLLTNYPELCEQLAPQNSISPTDVTPGSNQELLWICYNHTELTHPFTWHASVKHRISGKAGCPLCNTNGYAQQLGGHNHFVIEARLKHNNDYDYVEKYKGDKIKIAILCKRNVDHGIFMQSPHMHKTGQGCWRCASDLKESRGMRRLKELLDKISTPLGLIYYCEYKFDGLVYRGLLRCDIYIPALKLVIEYDGKQHFNITSWGGSDTLAENKIRDQLKDQFCMRSGLSLLRIPHTLDMTETMLLGVFEQCKLGQLYASYSHYQIETEKLLGTLLGKYVLTIPCPALK